MNSKVYFSKLKKIYTEEDCTIFVNGANLVHVLLSVIGFIALYLVLINFDQIAIANLLALIFLIFLAPSSATYTLTSLNAVDNTFVWQKFVLGILLSKYQGNISEQNGLLIKEITETDSSNEFVIYLETDKTDLVFFDIRRRSSLNRVLQFFDLNGIKYSVK